MSSYIVWWITGAILVGVELATGTFYLLAIGAAFAIGGFAAWLGVDTWVQFAIASIASVIGIFVAHRFRRRVTEPPLMPGLDIGQTVKVIEWRDDGTARVSYRGTQWDAEPDTPHTARLQTMIIKATRGSVLVLAEPRN